MVAVHVEVVGKGAIEDFRPTRVFVFSSAGVWETELAFNYSTTNRNGTSIGAYVARKGPEWPVAEKADVVIMFLRSSGDVFFLQNRDVAIERAD